MSENEQEKKKVTNSNLDIKLWAVGSVLFILMSVFGYLAYLNLHFPPTERENYATLGDSFGILSSLFSGLAFAGLIVTIVMQNKTLKAQMEELELARKEYKRQGDELAGQKDVMNAQFQSIQLQQFEITFFKMIDNLRAVIGSYDFGGDDKLTGYGKIKKDFSKIKSVGDAYDTINENIGFYKLYYENLMSIYRFSDSLDTTGKIKNSYFYMDIFKRYLTFQDLNFLFFYISLFKRLTFNVNDERNRSYMLFESFPIVNVLQEVSKNSMDDYKEIHSREDLDKYIEILNFYGFKFFSKTIENLKPNILDVSNHQKMIMDLCKETVSKYEIELAELKEARIKLKEDFFDKSFMEEIDKNADLKYDFSSVLKGYGFDQYGERIEGTTAEDDKCYSEYSIKIIDILNLENKLIPLHEKIKWQESVINKMNNLFEPLTPPAS